ncbi:MAG: hypothetical protein QE510_00300, partial [Verrucomicrobiota bacterium]|nr:hypothetical protein [Verrucomicrobiota bacterium]
MKAFLVLRGISFEKTHDIEVLIELARGIEPGFGGRRGRSLTFTQKGPLHTIRGPAGRWA